LEKHCFRGFTAYSVGTRPALQSVSNCELIDPTLLYLLHTRELLAPDFGRTTVYPEILKVASRRATGIDQLWAISGDFIAM
jgi:hypothetical protein